MDVNVNGKDTKEPPDKPDSKADEALLTEARERYEMGVEAWKENRKNYLEDLKFAVSNDLWDEQAKRARGKDRPALTMNKLNAITKQVIGDYRKNEIGIKVRPVDSKADVKKAKMRDGLIRNIQDVSNAQDAYVSALECAVRGGYGFIKIDTDYAEDDDFDLDIRIRRITNPLAVVPDPFYSDPVGADMRWCFETELLPKTEFERKYPDAKPKSWGSVEQGEWGEEWYEDGAVRVANYWRIELQKATAALLDDGERIAIDSPEHRQEILAFGKKIVRERPVERKKIRCYKLCGHAVIDRYGFPGRYIPIVVVPGEEVDIEGKRLFRSAIFYSKDAQRMSDYWKSAATETTALQPKAPFKGTAKEIQGYEKFWNSANSGNHQFLPFNRDPSNPAGPTREQPPAFSAGEINMALAAGDDIKATSGVYDASLGARSNETSGKAILARQREGDNATFIFIDNIARAIQQVGTVANDMIPEVYDAERTVRVLGADDETEIVTVNQQVFDPATMQYVTLNDLSEGKYDVTVTTGPSFATQRAEQADVLMELSRTNPQIGQLGADILVRSLDFKDADILADRIKRALPPNVTADPESPEAQQQAAQAQQQQQEAAQAQQQLAGMELQAKLAQAQADIATAQATVAKAEADKIKAQAEVVKATHPESAPQPDAAGGTTAPSAPPPAAPSVHLHLNAEDAMGQVAGHVQGMAAEHAMNTAGLAQVLDAISATLAANQQLNAEQATLLHQLVASTGQMHGEMAQAVHALAAAAEMQNRIALAPVVPTRDPKTKQIVAAQKVLAAPIERA